MQSFKWPERPATVRDATWASIPYRPGVLLMVIAVSLYVGFFSGCLLAVGSGHDSYAAYNHMEATRIKALEAQAFTAGFRAGMVEGAD
jgi:hypothetical protein